MFKKIRFFRNQYVVAVAVFLIVSVVLFQPFVFKGLIPIPGDILIGTYYPWLNQKWGFAVSPPVKNPLMSDVVSLMYPWRKLAIDYMKQGQLPLWDPTSFMGQSLIGNFQAGIFNPLNILYFLPLSFQFVWGIQVVLQPLLAMFFSFLVFKSWRLKLVPALAGAIGYGLSGPMIIWAEYNLLGYLIVLLPLALLIVNNIILQQKRRWLLGLSVVVAAGIFAGYIQMLYYILFFSYLYGLGLFIKKFDLKKIILWTALFGSAVLVGLLTAGIQLLPGFEAVQNSIRNLDVVAAGNAVVFLPYQQLLTAVVPDFYGNPASYNYFGLGSYESFGFYTTGALIPFCIWAFAMKKNRRLAVIMGIFVVGSLLMALNGPVAWLVQSLSFLGLKGSVSSRVLFVYSFGLSALGALGLEVLLEQKKNLLSLRSLWALAVLTGISLGGLICWLWLHQVAVHSSYGNFIQTDLKNVVIVLRNCVIPFLVCLLSTISLLFIRKFPSLGWIVILLIVFDMARFGTKYLPFTDPKLVSPETPLLTYLKNQPQPFRIGIEKGELLTANTWSVYGLQSLTGYNILLPKNSADFVSLLNNGQIGKENARFLDISNFDSPLLDLSNTTYVLGLLRKNGVPDPQGELSYLLKNPKFQLVDHEGPVALLKNTHSLPRYFIAPQIQVFSDSNQFYAALTKADFDPQKTALTMQELPIKQSDDCQIDLSSYTKQSYNFKTNCSAPGLLLVSEAFHKGWQASVNGQDATVYKTDGQFMGVVVPQGQASTYLQFMPRSFVNGVYITIAGIVMLIVSWFFLPRLKMVLLKD